MSEVMKFLRGPSVPEHATLMSEQNSPITLEIGAHTIDHPLTRSAVQEGFNLFSSPTELGIQQSVPYSEKASAAK